MKNTMEWVEDVQQSHMWSREGHMKASPPSDGCSSCVRTLKLVFLPWQQHNIVVFLQVWTSAQTWQSSAGLPSQWSLLVWSLFWTLVVPSSSWSEFFEMIVNNDHLNHAVTVKWHLKTVFLYVTSNLFFTRRRRQKYMWLTCSNWSI